MRETTGSNLGFKNLVRLHATHAIGELKNLVQVDLPEAHQDF